MLAKRVDIPMQRNLLFQIKFQELIPFLLSKTYDAHVLSLK